MRGNTLWENYCYLIKSFDIERNFNITKLLHWSKGIWLQMTDEVNDKTWNVINEIIETIISFI